MFKLNVSNIKISQEYNPIKQSIQKALSACCTIVVSAGKDQWIGSGFHLGNGMVATAAHVVPKEILSIGHDIRLVFQDKTQYQAKIYKTESDFDSALLYCPNIIDKSSVELENSDLVQIGDTIATISAPEGWSFTATMGIVSNVHQYLGASAPSKAWNDIIFIDADILEGSSGGMVINSRGKVIGSIMGVTGAKAEIGIGQRSICPSNKIKKLINM